jgi:hypothetical protein
VEACIPRPVVDRVYGPWDIVGAQRRHRRLDCDGDTAQTADIVAPSGAVGLFGGKAVLRQWLAPPKHDPISA